MRKIESPCMTMHAYVHPATGITYLLRPVDHREQLIIEGVSFQLAAQNAFLQQLRCTLVLDDFDPDEDDMVVGWTLDWAREVVALHHLDHCPTEAEHDDAWNALLAALPLRTDCTEWRCPDDLTGL